MTATPQRKYALTKLAAGDYLLPSNDGRTIWRICTYMDGPSYGLENWSHDRRLWELREWTGLVEPGADFDPEDWDRWQRAASGFERRADAIEAAMQR